MRRTIAIECYKTVEANFYCEILTEMAESRSMISIVDCINFRALRGNQWHDIRHNKLVEYACLDNFVPTNGFLERKVLTCYC